MKLSKQFLCLATVIFSVLLVSPKNLNAQCPLMADSCDWDPCTLQGLTLGGEVLYWKPCISNLDIAFSFESDDNDYDVEYESICMDWEVGFRVFVSYQNCICSDWIIRSSWTHIRPDDSGKVEDENGSTPLLHPFLIDELEANGITFFNRVKGEFDMLYNDWDLVIARNLLCGPCQRFSPYFGIAGMFLDQEQTVFMRDAIEVVDGASTTSWLRWKSGYNSVGLRLGTYYEYSYNNCLSFFAGAEGSVLAGYVNSESKQKIVYIVDEATITTRMEIEDDENCHVVKGFHVNAGLKYDLYFMENFFTFRIGYEFVQWHNLPHPRIYFGDGSPIEDSHSTSPNTRTMGFHGMFAGLALSF